MIWNSIKHKNWKFRPEPLEESRWNPPNPARGWYAVYTFLAEQKIDPEELKWSLREGETVALVLLDIGAFRDRFLDKEALDNIREILLFFKNYKRDVIFRPVYDREGNGLLHEPDAFETVLTHLRQIGELLAVTEHSVFVWQGLLVGSWGEMHTSRYADIMSVRILMADEKLYTALFGRRHIPGSPYTGAVENACRRR